MKSKRFSLAVAGALLLGVVLAGCGERFGAEPHATGGSTRQETMREPTRDDNEGGVITAANASSFSDDAIVLAARAAGGPDVSTEAAARFDEDLGRIRKEHPRLAGIHARPAFVPDEMLVALKNGAPWRERWRDGQVETSDAEVDRFLKEYGADGVRPLLPPGESAREEARLEVFVLHFGRPLNVEVLAREFEVVSEEVRYAEPNGVVGGGDDIVFEGSDDDARKYVFSEGSGDCMAGCIERRSWRVTLHADSGVSVEESGDGPGDGAKRSETATLLGSVRA